MNPTLQAIPTNTALYLGPYTPVPLAGCFGDHTKSSFSRITYIPTLHGMNIGGGGHANTPNTARDTLYLDTVSAGTSTWAQEFPPTPMADLNFANFNEALGCWNSTGHMRTKHEYDLTVWCPNINELVVIQRMSDGATCQQGTFPNYTTANFPRGVIWHWNPENKATFPGNGYTPSGVATPWAIGQTPSAAFDPVSGKIIIDGKTGFWIYDPVAKTPVQIINTTNKSWMIDSENLVYFPPNDKFYHFCNEGVVTEITLNRSNWNASTIVKMMGITGTPPPLPHQGGPGTAGGETGWAYDCVNQIIGGGITEGKFHAFRPIEKTWEQSTIITDPATRTLGRLCFHCIDFDPENGVFVAIETVPKQGGGYNAFTWAYCYHRLPKIPPEEHLPGGLTLPAIAAWWESQLQRYETFIQEVSIMTQATEEYLSNAVQTVVGAIGNGRDEVVSAIQALPPPEGDGLTTEQVDAAVTTVNNSFDTAKTAILNALQPA